jgi:uncharacterized protein (DUF1810 family)
MDCAIDTASAEQGRIRRIDDGVSRLLGDVARPVDLNDFLIAQQKSHKKFSTRRDLSHKLVPAAPEDPMFGNPQHSSSDPYHLERFLLAQDRVYPRVLSELQAGAKMSHWMWFIFPQIRGLGRSPMSIEYAIDSRDAACAYLQHPILGSRLKECTALVLQVERRSARDIFGEPDDIKFRSSMTLFAQVSSDDDIFEQALQKYFDGIPDQLTIDRM